MRASRILSPVLLVLLVSFGSGQTRGGAAGDHTQAPVPALAEEPAGASRCKVCHSSQVEGYARSAMAHSLRRAGQEPAGVVNAPDAKITMYSTPAGSWQRLQAAGDVSNYRIDYVIGSGNHASGYLVDIAGHLFQSPVAFYKSRNAYDLAPGYEKTQDPDFTRPVAEGCVFCHAGTDLHVPGTDNQYRSPVFPAEAITCERCHGPSEKHLADPRAGTIVNPAKLEPGARDSICEQCHLMGVARVPNPGREFRDFQPGERLESVFTTYHDALPPNTPAGAFKVISHVEQLAMSACARNSQGRLWCGTCHDPHNKPVEAVPYYRSRCLSCHMGAFPASHPSAESNCIGCHMPRRNAKDGGHTAFTDHRIQRRPEPQTGLLPAADIAAWRDPAPDLQKRNLGIAYINAGFQRRSSQFIVQGYRLLTEVQNQFATDPDVFSWMGTALLVGKQPSEAELAFDRVLALDPNSVTAETNAAAAHQQAGDIEGTIAHLERAVAIDPMHLAATSLLLRLYQQQGNPAKANQVADRVRAIMAEQPDPSQLRPEGSVLGSQKPAEAVFKNIKMLRGVPSDRIIPAMRFIASSLGVQCSYCHVEGHFEDDAKKPKQVARGMMRMMFAINQTNFEGTREVTCYSCHRGALKPDTVPALGSDVASTREVATDLKTHELPVGLPTGEEIIDNYIRALGGAAALEKITTRVESGTAEVEGKSIPVEVLTKAPDKQLSIEHTPGGDSVAALKGSAGSIRSPGRPPRELHGFDLETARADADLQFALHIRQMFPELRVEYPQTVDGREVYVVMGVRKEEPPWKFFFDSQSGLLVRLVRYSESPLGRDPTEIDYGDYREVDNVKTPFLRTIARSGSRTIIRIKEMQQNVAIEDARFANP